MTEPFLSTRSSISLTSTQLATGSWMRRASPTHQIIERRRHAEFITPVPKPRKRKGATEQKTIIFDEGKGLSTEEQRYDPTPVINELRRHVDRWRSLPNPNDWQVTPETARLLQHWRHHKFNEIRPFFCRVEAVEVDRPWVIGHSGEGIRPHAASAT